MKYAFKAKLEYFSVLNLGADFLKKLEYKLPFGNLKDLTHNSIILKIKIKKKRKLPGMSQGVSLNKKT